MNDDLKSMLTLLVQEMKEAIATGDDLLIQHRIEYLELFVSSIPDKAMLLTELGEVVR
ncbi:hypothetical protein [Periweissella fabalis]|uniref:Uncharacterized protein n=1 Tax=Periweissella fabalis TaxID=1070421 RepID=A0A7X6N0J8_9LACO|nr:hypothetical protein [Periweissella fabalis]MCM0599212.1 hypothetical protein [Periweissella fabalis]NKZ23491.1 hypothetical protein [Periweissella fabalis]